MLGLLKKELLRAFREPSNYIVMFVFPLVLIIMLSNAFGPLISGESTVEDGYYNIVIEEESDYFQEEILLELFDSIDFIHVESYSLDQTLEMVEDKKINGYILVDASNIDFHDFNTESYASQILSEILEIYANKADVVKLAIEAGRLDMIEEFQVINEKIEVEQVKGTEGFTPYNYFAVTIVALFVAWFSQMPISDMEGELNQNTLLRQKVSPVSINSIFWAKILSFMIQAMIQGIFILLANELAFGVDYRNIGLVFITMLSGSFLFINLGLMMASFNLKEGLAATITQLIMQAAIFFGGSYLPITENMGILVEIKKYSPIGWLNDSILTYMTDGRSQMIFETIGKNLVLGLAMLVISYHLFKRKKVL